MPGRQYSADDYRYGFNGMEKDDEVKGAGNSYTSQYRLLDPRIGRWLTIDPASRELPWQSPYVSMDNSPVLYMDPDGDKVKYWSGKEKRDVRRARRTNAVFKEQFKAWKKSPDVFVFHYRRKHIPALVVSNATWYGGASRGGRGLWHVDYGEMKIIDSKPPNIILQSLSPEVRGGDKEVPVIEFLRDENVDKMKTFSDGESYTPTSDNLEMYTTGFLMDETSNYLDDLASKIRDSNITNVTISTDMGDSKSDPSGAGTRMAFSRQANATITNYLNSALQGSGIRVVQGSITIDRDDRPHTTITIGTKKE